jgi:hypothetical protein
VDRIANYLDEFMLQKGIDPQQIDSLFLTGCTSMGVVSKNALKTDFLMLTAIRAIISKVWPGLMLLINR